MKVLPQEWIYRKSGGYPPTIVLKNGSEIVFHSAEPPADRLRGYAVDFLIIDEAAMLKAEVWHDILRPTLADKLGRMIAISTPKGHNWFYEMWLQGQDKSNEEVQSWRFPTKANKYIASSEIIAAKKGIPELSFRQEWEAEFLEDIGAVFRNINGCIKGALEEYNPKKYYKMGVDLAKYYDFTVCVVMDNNHHVVAFDRFNEMNYVFQEQRIMALAKKYNASVIIDSTGIGDPIYDTLNRAGMTIEPYKFTMQSKANLVENLSIQMEQGNISYPVIDVMINELKIFGFEKTDAGRITYGAPEGFHDDCVIALALATWAHTSKSSLLVDLLDTTMPKGFFHI